jgi:prepilin peptidase CpaA
MSDDIAASIFSSTQQVLWIGIVPLLLLLLGAAWSDAQSRRIPNRLVFGGALLAVALHLALPAGAGFMSLLPGGLGLLGALEGLLIGLGVFFPLYLLRAMGAGDVKLMAMVGAFLGPAQIWGALLGVALIGGVLAIVVALMEGVLWRMLQNVRSILYGGAMQLATGARYGELSALRGLAPELHLIRCTWR